VQDILFVEHMVPLIQHMLVFLGLAYLFTKTRVFTSLVNNTLSLPDKVVIYLVFSGFCILGTLLSEQSFQSASAIANTRAIGAVLGGLLGGPVVGFLVGVTGGIHRVLSMSSPVDPVSQVDIACAVGTTAEGLFAGLVHYYHSRKGRVEVLFSPRFVLLIAFIAELGHMLIILLFGLFSEEGEAAWALIKEIAPPMLVANSLGASLIMYMIREQKRSCDQLSSNTTALRIANQTAGIMYSGFDQKSSNQIAKIIRDEIKVAAVAITDRSRLLAFTGLGEEHHMPGSVISSPDTITAIRENRVIFTDGIQSVYRCRLQDSCQLGSVLIIPLRDDVGDNVFGTIKLYEPKNRLFRNINRTLGEEIAHLLSSRIMTSRFARQRESLLEVRYKLLTAQVNPHFLYNALTTIGHITGSNPQRAHELLQHLSDFFRKSLEGASDETELKNELDHVVSYLEIEKARFEGRLQINIDIPKHLLRQKAPVFTLQPIVENAIKHGTSELLGTGIISITGQDLERAFILTVEDNAGRYTGARLGGIGLKIDERIKMRFGSEYGLTILCEPNQWTKVNIRLPKTEE